MEIHLFPHGSVSFWDGVYIEAGIWRKREGTNGRMLQGRLLRFHPIA